MGSVTIRLATAADMSAVNDIYNYYVPRSTCTYQLEPEPIEGRMTWFQHHTPDKYPVTVAEVDGEVVGWGSLSKFRERAAYNPTVEGSIYIRHDQHRKGLGRLILLDLIERARALGYHSLIGAVDAEQTASIALQENMGFKRVGYLSQVAYKFDRWLDVIYMQLILE